MMDEVAQELNGDFIETVIALFKRKIEKGKLTIS